MEVFKRDDAGGVGETEAVPLLLLLLALLVLEMEVGTTTPSSEATRKEESEAHNKNDNNNNNENEYGEWIDPEKHPQTNRPILNSCVTEIVVVLVFIFVFDRVLADEAPMEGSRIQHVFDSATRREISVTTNLAFFEKSYGCNATHPIPLLTYHC